MDVSGGLSQKHAGEMVRPGQQVLRVGHADMNSESLSPDLCDLIIHHHAFTPTGGQEDDARRFECPAYLIAGAFMHAQIVDRLQTFERGQGYEGLVSERLLVPAE